MKRLWALAPLAAFAVLGAAFIVMLARGGGERGFSKDGLVGAPAPDYALERLEGGAPVRPSEFAGRPHLVNFFASWCGPCRVEHPMLAALQRQGVLVVGVDYKDSPEKARAMLAQLGDPYAVVARDPSGRTGLDYGITGVPETFVIGADGRIVALFRGPLDPGAINAKIAPALRRAAK